MRFIRCERLKRWGIGALVLLLLHGLGAARSAWAGCNHLVGSKSDRLVDFHGLDALVAGDASSFVPDNPARDQIPHRPTPCSGPGCSSRVPMPSPTAVPDSDRSDQWGALNALARLPLPSPPHRVIDEPAARPTGKTPSIFHPPPA
jgi:hypothetical protein